jgi:hypothetical protein
MCEDKNVLHACNPSSVWQIGVEYRSKTKGVNGPDISHFDSDLDRKHDYQTT